ncbi:MAG TPA: hypothetical protein VM261_28925 [Kofleriaceae bacterium]|nr:hypothetical protein [Kofleriaceae bacterium]
MSRHLGGADCRRLWLLALLAVAACGGTRERPPRPEHLSDDAGADATRDRDATPTPTPTPTPGPVTGPLVPAITDPATLAELESHGFRLEARLGAGSARNNAELHAASAWYRELVAFAVEDVAASIAEENHYRPDWGPVGPTLRAKRRNLDVGWLRATNASYDLVGVVNRMDRAPMRPGTCGDLLLIYRLAYRGAKLSSRLPLTVNVVYSLAPVGGDCRALVRQWRLPTPLSVEWLTTDGPLQARNLERLQQIQTNYQVIRSAAGIRNQLGGSSEYALRAFHVRDGHLVRAPLANTPDVRRLAAEPALRQELLAFLRQEESLRAIDRGTILIPERFLATRVSSFAPHGLARMQNRLFDALFDPADFAGLDLAAQRSVRSPEAVLRRLDDLTCAGCHQGRTIAGFHFLGEDRAGTHPLNAIRFAGSGHFRTDLVRRVAYLEALERGDEPAADRPLSYAPTGARAESGDACALPGAVSIDWVCDDGLACQVITAAAGDAETGHCFPEQHRAGDPCLRSAVIQDHHSLDKMVMPWTELGCAPGYACRMPGGGFPSGMCTSKCSEIASPGEICGPTAGAGFGDCLAGRSTFDQCLERFNELASRGRCNAQRSCRDDYVCARIAGEPDGACLPAYFLFQLRVDGHPAPDTKP